MISIKTKCKIVDMTPDVFYITQMENKDEYNISLLRAYLTLDLDYFPEIGDIIYFWPSEGLDDEGCPIMKITFIDGENLISRKWKSFIKEH